MRLDKFRQKATPRAISSCPLCSVEIIAKCGNIKVWHWAHKNLLECDHWWEPVSEWHLSWQNCVDEKFIEVPIGNHRADIQLPNGMVIELQSSSLSEDEVSERECFYNNMIWVFNGEKFKERFKFYHKISKYGNEYVTFYWKRPRTYIGMTEKPVYIDFGGDEILKIKEFTFEDVLKEWNGKEYETKQFKGWGHIFTRQEAYHYLFGQNYLPQIEIGNKK